MPCPAPRGDYSNKKCGGYAMADKILLHFIPVLRHFQAYLAQIYK
jgi:hypothetical protein